MLAWRGALDMGRNPALAGLHWGLSLAMGLAVGLIYMHLPLDISGAQDRLGALLAHRATQPTDALSTEKQYEVAVQVLSCCLRMLPHK